MVRDFLNGDKDNASFYAGILISAFALSESLTGMFWGTVSDRVGRKPILLIGCAGTMLSMVMFGFATNLWLAVIARVLGGLLNGERLQVEMLRSLMTLRLGNIGVIQTMVGELVKKPEHERMSLRYSTDTGC